MDSKNEDRVNLNQMIKSISPVIKLLQLSEGKNKLFAVLQYSCKLIGSVMISSIDETILLESTTLMK